MVNRKAVEWISTVLYVLIGLAIIASLLAIIQPEVSRLKDRFIISQTIESLDTLDETIMRTRDSTGTRLNYVLSLEEGSLVIDAVNNKIIWSMISDYQYSQENKTIEVGRLKATTTPSAKVWDVKLELEYTGYNLNITVNNQDTSKTLSKSGLPYSMWIENKGKSGNTQQIDFLI